MAPGAEWPTLAGLVRHLLLSCSTLAGLFDPKSRTLAASPPRSTAQGQSRRACGLDVGLAVGEPRTRHAAQSVQCTLYLHPNYYREYRALRYGLCAYGFMGLSHGLSLSHTHIKYNRELFIARAIPVSHTCAHLRTVVRSAFTFLIRTL